MNLWFVSFHFTITLFVLLVVVVAVGVGLVLGYILLYAYWLDLYMYLMGTEPSGVITIISCIDAYHVRSTEYINWIFRELGSCMYVCMYVCIRYYDIT